ncbi:MAG: hypothetical protein ACTSXZ_06035, partial [Alphaproteobacteria bacterium]
CIVWERTNWVPQKKKDDIYVRSETGINAGNYVVDVSCPGSQCLPDTPRTLETLCGNNPLGRSLAQGSAFGDRWKLHQTRLTPKRYETIRAAAWEQFNTVWSVHYARVYQLSGFSYSWEQTPRHLRTTFELQLLRYLRNYLMAAHGTSFDDEQLWQCFAVMPQRPIWNAIETDNLAFLAAREVVARHQNTAAWDDLRTVTDAEWNRLIWRH